MRLSGSISSTRSGSLRDEAMPKIEWEKEVPVVVAEFLKRYRKSDNQETYRALRSSSIRPLTPMSEIRKLVKRYSKKGSMPIRVSFRAFEDSPDYDAFYTYKGPGRGTIYLHPILVYYPKSYVEGVIQHELEHADVEYRWEDIL